MIIPHHISTLGWPNVFTGIVSFLLGVLMAPVVRPLLRPVFVEAVRLALAAWREAQRVSVTVKEDIEDAVAKDRAEQERKAHAAAQVASDPASSSIKVN